MSTRVDRLVSRWLGMVLPAAVLVLFALVAPAARAQSKHLAPGFDALPADAKVIVAPLDVELFSISAGGVLEPRADWTAQAQTHIRNALKARVAQLGLRSDEMDDASADELAEVLHLHAAVAQAIALHHSFGGAWALPTKEGKLDWTFGDTMKVLQERTGARYGLFTWVRDSYASAERVATMIVLAALGVGISGGVQIGYASLVDLETGRVVWFNQLARGVGDLREESKAFESVNALLAGFPVTRK